MKQRVLFLCTGNSARSQMAEAFLRKLGGAYFEAYSAGLEPKGLNSLTVKVMEEAGYDLGGQYSKGVTEYGGKMFIQYLVTVCDQAEKNCPTTWPGIARRWHWSFADPAAATGTDEERLVKFREVRDQIERKVKEWLGEQGVPPAELL
jgi:arsenate reductase (thioredoxin)